MGHLSGSDSEGRVPHRLAADTFGAEEIEAAKAVLDSGRLTMATEVRAFEAELSAWTGAKPRTERSLPRRVRDG
jgi:hypothetical protein